MADVCPNLPDELDRLDKTIVAVPARVLHVSSESATDSPPAIDTSRHTCECLCTYCERNRTGQFAQRAAIAGDQSAAAKLSPRVLAALATQVSRSSRKRSAA